MPGKVLEEAAILHRVPGCFTADRTLTFATVRQVQQSKEGSMPGVSVSAPGT